MFRWDDCFDLQGLVSVASHSVSSSSDLFCGTAAVRQRKQLTSPRAFGIKDWGEHLSPCVRRTWGIELVGWVMGEMCFWLKSEHSDFSLCCYQCSPSLRNRGERGWEGLKKMGQEDINWWSVKEKREVWFGFGMCNEGGSLKFWGKAEWVIDVNRKEGVRELRSESLKMCLQCGSTKKESLLLFSTILIQNKHGARLHVVLTPFFSLAM